MGVEPVDPWVTVCIGTYGQPSWPKLATERAIPSAEALNVPVVHVHADTLHDARNGALAQAKTPFVCFLDADDELEQGYFHWMKKGTADMRAPSIRQVRLNFNAQIVGTPFMPQVFRHNHQCTADCLRVGNWLVIGTVVRTDLIREVGGWKDFNWSEDWSTWARCWQAGGTVEPIHRAVYRAYVYANSRNRSLSNAQIVATHRAIEMDTWGTCVDPRTHPARA